MRKKRLPKEEAAHRVAVKRAYALFQNGDHVTDRQVRLLIKTIEAAEPLLSIPDFKLAQFYAHLDLNRLKGLLEWRADRRKLRDA